MTYEQPRIERAAAVLWQQAGNLMWLDANEQQQLEYMRNARAIIDAYNQSEERTK